MPQQQAADSPVVDLKARRMFYMDNLRLSFTFLVILHHLCLTYTGEPGWYYYDRIEDPFTNLVMTLLMTVNRNWVLAAFFLISGYFTPGSLDKKGLKSYLKERFIRIGIPLAIFAVLIRPPMYYALHHDTISLDSFLRNFPSYIAPGPAWFLEVLLIFSIAYGLWRAFRGHGNSSPGRSFGFPGNGWIIAFIIILGCCTFVFRIFFPHEKQVFSLRIGNYADYVAFFAVGVLAFRYKWIDKLTDRTGAQWTIITSIAVIVYAALVIPAWYAHETLRFLRGGASFMTFIATIIGTFIAVGSSISLIYIFRRFMNAQPPFVRSLARDAYAAFIFHPPIIIGWAYVIHGMTSFPFLKFLIAFVGGSVLCFVICRYIVRNIPYSGRVL